MLCTELPEYFSLQSILPLSFSLSDRRVMGLALLTLITCSRCWFSTVACPGGESLAVILRAGGDCPSHHHHVFLIRPLRGSITNIQMCHCCLLSHIWCYTLRLTKLTGLKTVEHGAVNSVFDWQELLLVKASLSLCLFPCQCGRRQEPVICHHSAKWVIY